MPNASGRGNPDGPSTVGSPMQIAKSGDRARVPLRGRTVNAIELTTGALTSPAPSGNT